MKLKFMNCINEEGQFSHQNPFPMCFVAIIIWNYVRKENRSINVIS